MRSSSPNIRVLIADDSFFMRKLLRGLLDSDHKVEVVGEARDGEEAVSLAKVLLPDVITMDYLMPKKNGAEATKEIMKSVHPSPGILMVSAYTSSGAKATLESLHAGALDYVLKPSGELSLDLEKKSSEILAKIHAASGHKGSVRKGAPRIHKKVMEQKIFLADAVILGASTGGPPLLEEILAELPSNIRAPIFIVQHMPKYFTEIFSVRLSAMCRLPVKEAQDGDSVQGGRIFVSPGGFQMKFKSPRNSNGRKIISLEKEKEKDENLTPSIDQIMSSAVDAYGKRVLGIVLTGMGEDGREGLRSIHKMGGYVIVQDPRTAVVASMPQSAIREKIVDEILAPADIIRRIIAFAS
ncbi:MAG: two-component system, chemotaxis family, response regulator CheB [Parcubacteria group bacterium Gr01-1014_18]|nr:MAG: two-component system, chemotaxis family, response regulator CheB [Parcubacteria group bacterium Greene0416_36]TSC80999.1 MAG: two-component system, chemotaxis family, response regulator CheB [Parcubacteria group bacterium Gr01-1014_18]TSC98886.1 MAG: two-component system, chemotaxis family, response regulator CheB [Parcubacteria group bacterium Greene1014_20]TSD06528.1 MAG: two-component system, chemotaxis family, response regulator CheB [Parcubacteria group bacterium Greene0714_2]